MKNKMTVLKGSSINADNLTIIIIDEENKLFEQTYYYGYDVSYNPMFVSEETPLDEELIKEKAKEYNINIEDIQYGEGRNIFKEFMERQLK